jgi:hypothetical protein
LKTARILASPLSERNVASSLSPISSSYAYALSTSSSRCASSAYVLCTRIHVLYTRICGLHTLIYVLYTRVYCTHVRHVYQLGQVRIVRQRIIIIIPTICYFIIPNICYSLYILSRHTHSLFFYYCLQHRVPLETVAQVFLSGCVVLHLFFLFI